LERGARCSEISGAAVAGVRAVPGGEGAPARAPALSIGPIEAEAEAEKATAAVRLERFVTGAAGFCSTAVTSGDKVLRDRLQYDGRRPFRPDTVQRRRPRPPRGRGGLGPSGPGAELRQASMQL
jgi:hypothetical protein